MHLAASAAHIWAECPASVALPKIKTEYSDAAREGTMCHELAVSWGQSAPAVLARNEAHAARLGVVVTEEMSGMASDAVDFCMTKTDTPPLWERRLTPHLPDGVGGDVDFVGYDSKTHTIHIVDLKFGFTPVEVLWNWQLLIYSIGAWRALGTDPRVDNFGLHIFQPRDYVNGAEKSWTLTVADWLRITEKLKRRIDAAQAKTKPAKTGAWCRYCHSRTYCPAFLETAFELLETVRDNPDAVEVGALGVEYEHLLQAEERIKSARKGFEDRIKSELAKGRAVKGWRMGATKAKRRISAPLSEIRAVESLTGAKLIEEKPVSITAAWRNVAARPLLETLITTSGGGKKTLVQYDKTEVKEIFK